MRTRHHFISIEDARAGMVLSQSANIVDHGFLSLTFPAGHELTEENLSQLNTCHAEFIDIEVLDARSDEQVAVDAASAAKRVLQIFDGADLSDPNMAALFDQVLAYRSA